MAGRVAGSIRPRAGGLAKGKPPLPGAAPDSPSSFVLGRTEPETDGAGSWRAAARPTPARPGSPKVRNDIAAIVFAMLINIMFTLMYTLNVSCSAS